MAKFTNRQDIVNFEKKPLPQMPSSVYGVLANSAEKYAERMALRFFLQGTAYKKSVDFTYAQLMGKINATANMFRDLGIGDKDVVTYILPNLPETLFTVYGGETAGIVNAINPLLDPEHIIDIMNAAGSKILVTIAPFPKTDLWEKVSKIAPKVPTLKTVLTVDIKNYLGFLPRTIVGLTSKKPKLNGSIEVLDFSKTLKKYATEKLSFQRNIKPSDIASYFHTGGTTGKPKIAQHTHDNEIFNAWTLENHMELEGFKVFFCGLPWFHVNAVMVTGLCPLSSGHTVVLGSPSGYRGEGVMSNFWKIMEHYKVSFFSGVPTILQMLLDVPQKGEDISSLEYAFLGAAPLSEQLFNDFEAASGLSIIEAYGFTEGTCASSVNPIHGVKKIGSIGLAGAHNFMKVVILDENGEYVRDAETDEIGNIVARGRNIFPGYKEAIHNKKAFINDGTHQWYNTGDLGRQDADSYFWITGRKKELIIRGGHNIDPKSIEEPLSKHPAVASVAAVPRPDKRVGELPAAYVQLKPNKTTTVAELLEFAKANIKERAAIPKVLEIIDNLPLTAIGKVFKPDLVKMQIKEVYEKELAQLEQVKKATVEVIQHPVKGLEAKVSLITKEKLDKADLENLLRQALGAYVVKYELV